MPSCDDCGIVFENMHDLQRHIKTWCPENLSLKRKRDDKEIQEDQPPQKWIPFEPEEKEEDKENQEDDVFNHLMKMAKEDNEKLWDRKYDKYIKKGLSREDARIQTEEKMNSLDQKVWTNHPVHSSIAKWFHSCKRYGRCSRFPIQRI